MAFTQEYNRKLRAGSYRQSPAEDANFETYNAARSAVGAFILAPAVLSGGEADIMTDIAILKRYFTVVMAADVRRHDIELVAFALVARQDAE